MSVLLDTHIWIWWFTPGSPLPRAEREALDSIAEREPPSISAMSLWEAQMLHSKRKLSLPVLFERWLREAAGPDVVRLALLDVDVTIAVDTLPRNFHGDSADRIIVATARALGLPLATHDRTIRRSRIVRIWKP